MKPEYLRSLFLLLAISVLLAGCSATSVKYYAAGDQPPLCGGENSPEKLVVYWGEAWRDDQKEVAKRSAVAEQVIEAFFRSKLSTGTNYTKPDDDFNLMSRLIKRGLVIVVRNAG